jgi:hypothetical protein
MTTVIVDADLASKLLAASGYVVLCDPSGKRLGHFNPAEAPIAPDAAKARSHFSDDEIEQFRSQKAEGRPLAEILNDLDETYT